MIRLLVVDDNAPRVEQTRGILNELEIPEDYVTYATSMLEAKRALSQTQYDVLLLDLVLPLRENTEPQANGGIDLLREIISLDYFKQPHRVFVISEFDDALQRMDSLANEVFCATIKYDCTSDEWSTRLKNYLEQILRATAESKEYNYDVAILCALETPELEEVKRLPFDWTPHNELGDTTDYFTGTFKGKTLICAAAYEMGLSSAAILATKMTTIFRPRYLVMTGIAGGVDSEKLHFGDVLIADPCFDYESGKKVYDKKLRESQFKPDYRQIRLDNSLTQIIRRLSGRTDMLEAIQNECTYDKPEDTLQIKIAPFGSGAAVLSDPTVIARVTEHNRKFLGFDMEAYAVMLSGTLSSSPKTIPIVMKAVSDFGDGKTDQYQKYAAYTSARVLQFFLEELFGQ